MFIINDWLPNIFFNLPTNISLHEGECFTSPLANQSTEPQTAGPFQPRNLIGVVNKIIKALGHVTRGEALERKRVPTLKLSCHRFVWQLLFLLFVLCLFNKVLLALKKVKVSRFRGSLLGNALINLGEAQVD